MSSTMETQRLISVSLGKIAQSRCQRGGLNLHKNLLVATVLHKARTAYIIESYNYQQHLHRQKLQHQQEMVYNTSPVSSASSQVVDVGLNKEEGSLSSCDSNMCHPTAASDDTPSGVPSSEGCEVTTPDVAPSQEMESDNQILHNKENSPPSIQDRLVFPENSSDSATKEPQESNTHNSNQAPRETQLPSSPNTSTTCKVMKRRRHHHGSTSSERDCPARKKARVSCNDLSLPTSSSELCSSENSDFESDSSPDSSQISNLVNIFNSGFSGLCAVPNDASTPRNSSTYQSDISQSQFTTQYRPESPTPAFSRMMPESSLLCSTQVSRMESLPSAIVLSA